MDGPIELFALDRDVRRALARFDEMRGWLSTERGRERARSFDPTAGVRQTSQQATYRGLQELAPSLLDVPLRDALLRWVHELTQARIGQELELDDADAVHARHEPRDEADVARTYDEAWRRVLLAGDGTRAAIAMSRAADLAPKVAAARNERRARRAEVARRLGLAHPWSLVLETAPSLPTAARALLDATDPLATELIKAEQRRTDGRWQATHAVHMACAKDAREGWPARLVPRWLDEIWKPIAPRGVGVTAQRLSEPLGGATFLRASAAWGFAMRTSGTPRSLPFALARDPYARSAHTFGAAMAIALADPKFHARVLGLPARIAFAQARSLRASLLFGARVIAARLLLSWEERPDASLFEETTSRVFGAPLPASLSGAWPEPRVDEPGRLLAILSAHGLVRGMVERYDEDWFRNPKAGQHLTSLACAPAWDGDPAPEDAPRAIARAFEEALG